MLCCGDVNTKRNMGAFQRKQPSRAMMLRAAAVARVPGTCHMLSMVLRYVTPAAHPGATLASAEPGLRASSVYLRTSQGRKGPGHILGTP